MRRSPRRQHQRLRLLRSLNQELRRLICRHNQRKPRLLLTLNTLSPDRLSTPISQNSNRRTLRNGQIVRGDLILLKIDRVKYLGQLKYNRESADARVSRAANSARGRDELGSALREVGGLPQRYRGKISIYSPNPTDVDNS